MGLESDDIDVALDNMCGEDFAKLICEHLDSNVDASDDAASKTSYHVIKANSEKSKHLETATIRIDDFAVDLVNLRSETYTENSRVPLVEIGTPEQDAYRRDLTINSLFYNINESRIEDWTGLGLQDIRDRIIRTPLDPVQTFLDDPLRLLRTVRFASRFDFTIVPQIEAAAKNPLLRVSPFTHAFTHHIT